MLSTEYEDNQGEVASLVIEEAQLDLGPLPVAVAIPERSELERGAGLSVIARQDDDFTEVKEEIDCVTEVRRRGISFQRFLHEFYENENPTVGPLGEPGFDNYDFLMIYDKPKVKQRVLRSQVSQPNVSLPLPPSRWGDEFEENLSSWSKVSSVADVQTIGIEGQKLESGVNASKQVVFHHPSE